MDTRSPMTMSRRRAIELNQHRDGRDLDADVGVDDPLRAELQEAVEAAWNALAVLLW